MSMTTTFYLIRHAESLAKEKGIVQGAGLSVPLSGEGKRQAEALAQTLKGEKFDAIFSSQAVRAIETAKPVRALFPDTPYSEHAELNERSKGEAEGMTKEEFKRRYPEIQAAWAREEDPRVSGGESFADVEKRVMPFLEKLASEQTGKRLLLIFHGNVIRVILGAILGAPANFRHRIKQDYCALNVIEYDDADCRRSILKVNETLL